MTKISLLALVLWLAAIIGVVVGSFMSSLAPPAALRIDLYVHFGAYGLLSGLPMFFAQSQKWRSILILLIIVFGIAVEWLQSFIPGRSASIDDAVVNLIGISLGALIAAIINDRITGFFYNARMNKERALSRLAQNVR